MLDVLKEIGDATVWAFWAPVVVWTGLAAVAAVVLGRVRGLHPTAGYRLRQALLLALPVSILAAPWMPGFWTPAALAPASLVPASGSLMRMPAGDLAPSVVPPLSGAVEGASVSAPGVNIVAVLLGLASVAIVLLAVARLAMVTADLRQLRRLRRMAPPVNDPAPRRMLRELAEQLGVRRPVALLEGPPGSAPLTFGAWRPVVVVPHVLLDSPGSLRTVLAHELIHIRRADYLWALFDCLTAAVFAFHPLVWLLRRGIERCRETSCDAELLARCFARPRPYAELLAHTHTPTQFPLPAVAASLSAPSLKLKERLETMKNFAHKRLTSRQRVGIVLGAGLVCMVIAIAGACAIRTEGEARGPLELSMIGEFPAEAVELVEQLRGVSSREAQTRIREYVEVLASRTSEERYYYTIPSFGEGGRVSTYYSATEEDVLNALGRIDVEAQYLREQMQATRDAIEAHHSAGDRMDPDAFMGELQDLQAKLDLLKTMRTERMRESETVKLEYETQKRRRGDPPTRLGR